MWTRRGCGMEKRADCQKGLVLICSWVKLMYVKWSYRWAWVEQAVQRGFFIWKVDDVLEGCHHILKYIYFILSIVSNLLTYLLPYHLRLTDIKLYLNFIWSTTCVQCMFFYINPKMVFYDWWELYDLWIISVFKCKIFNVYLKYSCNSSTLAQPNILQYIFSLTQHYFCTIKVH